MIDSKYDRRALEEIHAWKNPDIGRFRRAMKVINRPLDKAGDVVLRMPGVGEVIQQSIQGLIGVCNDAAQWSVQPEAIWKDFQNHGHGVGSLAEIRRLELEDVDRVVGWLDSKYKGCALAEGAVTGVVGLPGIPVDLTALITLNLRAIGEYATYSPG